MSEFVTIQSRRKYVANTDPQRRCYNGAHFSWEFRWTEWSDLDTVPRERADARLEFWRGLNAYAVSQRGSDDETQYRLREAA